MRAIHVVGARPNFVKADAVMSALDGKCDQILVHTGQHSAPELQFGREPDIELECKVFSDMVTNLVSAVNYHSAELVVVYGDVTSTLAGALAANKVGVKLAHVEAGLRSFDNSMSEEVVRITVDHLSAHRFAPSEDAMANLGREGLTCGNHLVGNVMIDSLQKVLKPKTTIHEPYAVLTLHRPCNVDSYDGLLSILDVIRDIPIHFKFPVHPRTRKNVNQFPFNVTLMDPVPYPEFVSMVQNARFVVTDSGGIQEETTYMNVPCLTLRPNTERPITVVLGTNTLVDKTTLLVEANRILSRGGKKLRTSPPLWDGEASTRIADILLR